METMKFAIIDSDPQLVFKDVVITKTDEDSYKFEGTYIQVHYCEQGTLFSHLFFKLGEKYREKLSEMVDKDQSLLDSDRKPYYTNLLDTTFSNDLSLMGLLLYYIIYSFAWFISITMLKIPKKFFCPLRLKEGYYALGKEKEMSRDMDEETLKQIKEIDDVRPFITNLIKRWD